MSETIRPGQSVRHPQRGQGVVRLVFGDGIADVSMADGTIHTAPAREFTRVSEAERTGAEAQGYTDGEYDREHGRPLADTRAAGAAYTRGYLAGIAGQRVSEAAPTSGHPVRCHCGACLATNPSYYRVTGGKAHRTERVRTDELAAGDVIEYSSGVREVVVAAGQRRYIGGSRSVRDLTIGGPDGVDTTRPYGTGMLWDRLTEDAKRELGYPTAEHDVPSEREPRETPDDLGIVRLGLWELLADAHSRVRQTVGPELRQRAFARRDALVEAVALATGQSTETVFELLSERDAL